MKCPSWFDAFEREIVKEDPDIAGICGLMPTKTVQLAKKYVALKNHIVEKYGIDQDIIRANLSMHAASNLLSFSPDSEVRIKATEKIVKAFKKEQLLTKADVDAILQIVPSNTPKPAIKPAEIRLPSNPQISLIQSTNGGIKEKERHICTANSNGLNSILADIQSAGFADSDYAAHCLAYKWAAERLKEEIAKKAVTA